MRVAHTFWIALLAAVSIVAIPSKAIATDQMPLLKDKCGGCHYSEETDSYTRIFDARRTPEGWQMTLLRMRRDHGVELSNQERLDLIAFLAEKQGISVAETAGYRYALEREPVSVDQAPEAELMEICGRCHSFARVALQRRSKDDWLKLVHFHLATWATTEYQALARDRDWFGIATSSVTDRLAELYPLGEAPGPATADFTGEWVVAGKQPGAGDFWGSMNVSTGAGGRYDVKASLEFANGDSMQQSGSAMVYADGEWRATLKSGDNSVRQVLAYSAGEGTMDGRWYIKGQDNLGGQMSAIKASAPTAVQAISPGYIKRGADQRVTVIGAGLDQGDLDFGSGMSVSIVSRSGNKIVADVKAAGSAEIGQRSVKVGSSGSGSLVVYDRVDAVKVSPDVEIARVGGGPVEKLTAQFDAIGYMAGADGKAGTEDDIEIGAMPADWKADNFDEFAAGLKDAEFAGSIDSRGLFTPNLGGPNPKRFMTANNAGNLKVTATVSDGSNTVEGSAQLYVTVQRFIDAQIR